MRRSLSERIFNVFNVIFLSLLSIATFYPFWHVACGSFSNGGELMNHTGILWLPLDFNFAAYQSVFKNNMVLTGLMNSLIVLVGATSVSMVLTTIGAYVLSRKNVFWNPFFTKLITITMFFGGGMIPFYLWVAKTMGMNNSLLALIIPTAIGTHNLFVMRASFLGIPDSLVESAQLDGASHAYILAKIVVPLSKAILAVITLYYAVGHWNAWFNASIFLRDRGKYPLQLVLREILIQNTAMAVGDATDNNDKYLVGETIKYATIMVSTVPILLFYPYLQRFFVKGIMVGAVKG
ncbi:MAG: carbohydrate ABC transporter permease [Clostridia bacterium]|nr:carbohydrate ABC transporter permease [Clostridia bacterium]